MHSAFLAAIADRPDDDLPRLVYADWLDENSQPERAEFIRTQIELAKLPEHDPRFLPLKARERELLAAHKDAWTLPGFRDISQHFRRGFVETVNATAEWLVGHPQAFDAPGPLRGVRVFTASGFLAALSEIPGLARLETLDLTNTRFAGADDVRAFFTTARLDNLRTLAVRNSNWWEGEELNALADTPVAERLRVLDLSGNRIGDAGVRVLASRPEFRNLESLTYRGDEIDYQLCVHAIGARALAESTTLTRLSVLDLGDQYLGDGGLPLLVNSPNAAGLKRLVLDYNDLGDIGEEWVGALVRSPYLGNLRDLVLCGNRLGSPGAGELANWPHLAQMRSVDLRECRAPIGANPLPLERRRSVGDGSAPLTADVRAILMRSPWAEKFVL
jgi:uncharacterized protein (TIGR02996 family)